MKNVSYLTMCPHCPFRHLNQDKMFMHINDVHYKSGGRVSALQRELETVKSELAMEKSKNSEHGSQVAKMNQIISASQEALQQEQKTVELLKEAKVCDYVQLIKGGQKVKFLVAHLQKLLEHRAARVSRGTRFLSILTGALKSNLHYQT